MATMTVDDLHGIVDGLRNAEDMTVRVLDTTTNVYMTIDRVYGDDNYLTLVVTHG